MDGVLPKSTLHYTLNILIMISIDSHTSQFCVSTIDIDIDIKVSQCLWCQQSAQEYAISTLPAYHRDINLIYGSTYRVCVYICNSFLWIINFYGHVLYYMHTFTCMQVSLHTDAYFVTHIHIYLCIIQICVYAGIPVCVG